MTRRHLVLLVIGVIAVSFSSVLVRIAHAPAVAIAFYRCAFSAAVLVPLAWARHREDLRRLGRNEAGLLVASGVVLAAHFATWIPSISFTTVAASALLVQTSPVWVAVLGRFVGERASRMTVVGIGLALAGVAVIALAQPGGRSGPRPLLGDLLALAGAFFAAIYILLGRRLRAVLPLVPYTAVVYAVSALILGVVMVAGGTPFAGYEPKVWLVCAAITAGPQFLGHTVFNYLLAHVRATVISVALLAEPIGATILALVLLREVPTWPTIAGGAVVLAGIYLAIASGPHGPAEVAGAPLE